MVIEKISEYIGRKYPTIRDQVGEERIHDLVEKFFDNMMYARKDGEIVGVAIWIKISYPAVKLIESGQMSVDNIKDFYELIDMPGNNYHIFCLAVDDASYIKSGMRKLIKDRNPDSVSWFRNRRFYEKTFRR